MGVSLDKQLKNRTGESWDTDGKCLGCPSWHQRVCDRLRLPRDGFSWMWVWRISSDGGNRAMCSSRRVWSSEGKMNLQENLAGWKYSKILFSWYVGPLRLHPRVYTYFSRSFFKGDLTDICLFPREWASRAKKFFIVIREYILHLHGEEESELI